MGIGTVLLVAVAALLLLGVGIPVLFLVAGLAKLIILALLVVFVVGLLMGAMRSARTRESETKPAP